MKGCAAPARCAALPRAARCLLGITLLASLLPFGPARAQAVDEDEPGGWLWVEYRQRLWNQAPRLPRFQLRILSDTRLTARSPVVLDQQFLRVGLWMEPTAWLAVSTNGTLNGERLADGRFVAESRLEQELYFTPVFGPIGITNRHRIEWRFRDGEDAKLRYRTLLRVQYQPRGLRFRPFVWNEWLLDSRVGFNEDRLVIGVNFVLPNSVLLDVGYLLRQRIVAGAWQRDHIVLLSFLIGVPPLAAKR